MVDNDVDTNRIQDYMRRLTLWGHVPMTYKDKCLLVATLLRTKVVTLEAVDPRTQGWSETVTQLLIEELERDEDAR